MRLLTFNIRTSRALTDLQHHWRFRRAAAVQAIENTHADVIALQEARPAALEYIAAALSEYTVVSAGRDDGLKKGEACPLLVGPGYTIEHFETMWFSPTPSVPGSKFEGVVTPRICSIARIAATGADRAIAIANTHLDTQFRDVRAKSIDLIGQWAKADQVPWVITGDFNCNIDSPEMVSLLESGWTDALAALPPEGTGAATFNGFKHITDGQRIDHVLLPKDCELRDAHIESNAHGKVPSDHWPVVVEFKLV